MATAAATVVILVFCQFLLTAKNPSPIYQSDEYAFMRLGQNHPRYEIPTSMDEGLQQASTVFMGLVATPLRTPDTQTTSHRMILMNHIFTALALIALLSAIQSVTGSISILSALMMSITAFGVWKNAYMADTSYFFLFSLVVWAVSKWRGRTHWAPLFSILCFLASITKPHGLVLTALVGAFLFLGSREKGIKSVKAPFLFGILFMLLWLFGSWIIFDRFEMKTTFFLGKLYKGLASEALNDSAKNHLYWAVIKNVLGSLAASLCLVGPTLLLLPWKKLFSNPKSSLSIFILFLVLALFAKIGMSSLFIVNQDETRIMGRYFSFVLIPLLGLLPALAPEHALSIRWRSMNFTLWAFCLGLIAFFKSFHFYPWDFPEFAPLTTPKITIYFLLLNPFFVFLFISLFGWRAKNLTIASLIFWLAFGSYNSYRWQLDRAVELSPFKQIGRDLNTLALQYGPVGFISDRNVRYNHGAAIMYQMQSNPFFAMTAENLQSLTAQSQEKINWLCLIQGVNGEPIIEIPSQFPLGTQIYNKSPVQCYLLEKKS